MRWPLLLLVLAGPAAAIAPPPAQDVIETGCTGGQSGGGTQTRIVADGRVVRLSLSRAGAPWQLEQRGFDLATYARLDRALADAVLARLRGTPPGNMTCWLERRSANGASRRIRWAGLDPPGSWPASVRAAVQELRALGR